MQFFGRKIAMGPNSNISPISYNKNMNKLPHLTLIHLVLSQRETTLFVVIDFFLFFQVLPHLKTMNAMLVMEVYF